MHAQKFQSAYHITVAEVNLWFTEDGVLETINGLRSPIYCLQDRKKFGHIVFI